MKSEVNDSHVKMLAALLVGVVLLVYGRVVTHEFIGYDDPLWITDNEMVQRGLSVEGIRWAFTTAEDGNWIPLTWLSHMALIESFGLSPGAHLLTNVFIHATTSGLLLLVLYSMTKRRWPSALVAALFALHPLHVESVAWATERKDVLAGLFWVLTIWAYLGYTRRPKTLRYGLVASLFVVGLLSKAMLVTLPFVLLLLDHWPLQRTHGGAWRRLLMEKAPLLTLAAGVSFVTYLAQGAVGSVDATGAPSMAERILNSLAAYGVYLAQTVWPFGLSVFYPTLSGGTLLGWAAVGLISVALALGTSFLWRRRRAYWAVGWLWFLGALIPVIGVVRIGFHGHADRYTYLPHIGLFIAIVWGATELIENRPAARKAASAFAAAVVFACAALTWNQVEHWRDSRALFEHALSVTIENATAHNMYGHALLAEGSAEEALGHFEKAAALDPLRAIYWHNLGVAQMQLDGLDDAKASFYRTLEIESAHWKTRYLLGILLLRANQWAAAAGQFEEVVAAQADHVGAHINLGVTLARLNRAEKSREHFLAALGIEPENADAHFNFALLLLRERQTTEAIGHLERALEQRPNHAAAHRALGALLEQAGDSEMAGFHLERAAQIESAAQTAGEPEV